MSTRPIPLQEFHDYVVTQSVLLPTENAAAENAATVLNLSLKPWTVHHIGLYFDRGAYGDGGGNPTVQFVKLPAGVTADEYNANNALGTALSGEINVNQNGGVAADTLYLVDLSSYTEAQRRLEAGDRLVCVTRGFAQASTVGSGSGSGVAPSGLNSAIGFEGAVVTYVGMTRRI